MKIKCISTDGNSFITEGKEYTVLDEDKWSYKIVCNSGSNHWYGKSLFEVVGGRPHRELIIQWANGAEIEYRVGNFNSWEYTSSPKFHPSIQYRVKPETHIIRIDDKDIVISHESFKALKEQLIG